MEKYMTNREILIEAQYKIISRGKDPNYSEEKHLEDIDLITELSKLKMIYG